MLMIGVVCIVIAAVDFFSVMGAGAGHGIGRGAPTKFWLFFVGTPMFAVGLSMTYFGNMGRVVRYFGREVGPAASHTLNEVARGSKPAVRAIGEAIRDGRSDEDESGEVCLGCGQENRPDAEFCRACGKELAGPTKCASCGVESEPGARFCDECGTALRN